MTFYSVLTSTPYALCSVYESVGEVLKLAIAAANTLFLLLLKIVVLEK